MEEMAGIVEAAAGGVGDVEVLSLSGRWGQRPTYIYIVGEGMGGKKAKSNDSNAKIEVKVSLSLVSGCAVVCGMLLPWWVQLRYITWIVELTVLKKNEISLFFLFDISSILSWLFFFFSKREAGDVHMCFFFLWQLFDLMGKKKIQVFHFIYFF